ncbi:putative LRR receptor-like serine/threonine-protein kinase [Hordeum vulgare]|nr:putative LRR receptor-like serine/threonine-protein kinase [Hordeum vulgare]
MAESDAHLREPGQRGRRPVCGACTKPLRVCLCGRLRGPPLDTAVGVTMLQHPTEAHHPLSSVRVARHSSTTYYFSPPPREAMASSPALLSPQYSHPSPPHPRRLLPPPPSAASPSMASNRLRLHVHRGPSPAQAKFGKFDTVDAPTEAAPATPAISKVKGATGQVVLEDDRSGTLLIQGNIARLVVDICAPLTWCQIPEIRNSEPLPMRRCRQQMTPGDLFLQPISNKHTPRTNSYVRMMLLLIMENPLLLNIISVTLLLPLCMSLLEEEVLAWKATLQSRPTLLQSWGNNTWPCTWHGITCTKHPTRHQEVITGISLQGLQLRGELEALNLTAFATLTTIHLSHNQISGSSPSDLPSSLPNLQHLMLQENELSGEIPSQIKQLEGLVGLNLLSNHFSGPIPSELGYLNKLATLDFSHNNLTSQIPRNLGNLTKLTSLYLDGNQFLGYIPPELGYLIN